VVSGTAFGTVVGVVFELPSSVHGRKCIEHTFDVQGPAAGTRVH
jgi:hypothetical protein